MNVGTNWEAHMSIPPMPTLDASLSRMTCLVKLCNIKTGVVISASFRTLNTSSTSSDEWKGVFSVVT